MAKSKWDRVKEKLKLVEKWARDGLTEEQIAKNLGISKSTMTTYKNTQPTFLTAIKRGKEVIITEIENALIKRALGYEYEEVRTYIKVEGEGDEEKTVQYTEKTKKQMAPDVAACSILLKNKDRGNWSDNPMKIELDREMLELKKEIERMRNF